MIFHLLFPAASAFNFTYRDYDAINKRMYKLAKYFPDYVEVFDALEEWPRIAPNMSEVPKCWTRISGSWKKERCKFLVIHIANMTEYKKSNNLMPEMYISGALHGNERVGPQVVMGLAAFLIKEHKARHFMIEHLLNTRSLWMTPMTNAIGYGFNSTGLRKENGKDPNRDFPYNTGNSPCMDTIAARVVAEIYRTQMIRISVTLHGGTESISRPWGATNHAKRGDSTLSKCSAAQCKVKDTYRQYLQQGCCISEDAPDQKAFEAIDDDLHEAYGQVEGNCSHFMPSKGAGWQKTMHKYQVDGKDGCWYFPPPGPATNVVYAVNGGMEDFSYAYSWESEHSSPNPIPDVCSSSRYGGYTMKRDDWNKTVKQVNYLIELTGSKNEGKNYGNSDQVYRSPSKKDGQHVTRSVRALIRLLEYTKPEIMFWETGFVGIGCKKFEATLFKWNKPVSSECGDRDHSSSDVEEKFGEKDCVPVQYWQETAEEHEKKYPETPMVKYDKLDPKYCYAIEARFDYQWNSKVGTARPNVKPQTHLVRERVDDTYEVDNANGTGPMINAASSRWFPVPRHLYSSSAASKPEPVSVIGKCCKPNSSVVRSGDAKLWYGKMKSETECEYWIYEDGSHTTHVSNSKTMVSEEQCKNDNGRIEETEKSVCICSRLSLGFVSGESAALTRSATRNIEVADNDNRLDYTNLAIIIVLIVFVVVLCVVGYRFYVRKIGQRDATDLNLKSGGKKEVKASSKSKASTSEWKGSRRGNGGSMPKSQLRSEYPKSFLKKSEDSKPSVKKSERAKSSVRKSEGAKSSVRKSEGAKSSVRKTQGTKFAPNNGGRSRRNKSKGGRKKSVKA